MSAELGDVLRRAREAKGLTLEDLQERTKIQRHYLEAIERGDLHVLPGHFYTRAFVRRYAEVVGLDPDEIVRQYEAILPKTEETAPIPTITQTRASRRRVVTAGGWTVRVLLYVFVALIVTVLVFALREGTSPGPDGQDPFHDGMVQIESPPAADAGTVKTVPEPPTAPGTPTDQAGEPAQPSEPVTQPQLQPVKTDGPTWVYVVKGVDRLTIAVTASRERCWLQVRKAEEAGGKFRNGAVIEEVSLARGQSKTWEVTDAAAVRLRLGNAPGVDVTINGVSLPTADMPQPVSVYVKREALPTPSGT